MMQIVYRGKTNTLYIRSGNICFPDLNWSDLVAPTVSGWLDDCLKFARGESASLRLYFMDGPYFLDCRESNGRIEVTATDDHDGRAVFTEECDLSELLELICVTAREIVSTDSTAESKSLGTNLIIAERYLSDGT